jgi:TM2 domain-containing membrane protein YozV
MTSPSVPEHPTSLLAGILSYLVPGLGQIYQGRIGKGVLFMVCLLSLFFTGQAMGGWKNVYIPTNDPQVWDNGNGFNPPQNVRQQRFGQIFRNLYQRWHYVGQFWIGVAAWPALWQYFEMPAPSPETQPFLSRLQRAPSETEINDFLVNSDKTPDLGWIYTVIAGVLNILVIYDAYAGPAFPGDPRKLKQPAEKGV